MISVIIPLYNKENCIKRTIESVINQTYTNWECIVIDDGSNDNSSEVLKEINDDRIVYIYQENKGVSSARNNGVLKSKGEWIVFLDADDYLLPNALATLIDIVTKYNCKCGAANFNMEINNSFKLYSDLKEGIVKQPFKEWHKSNFCPRTGAAIFKRDIAITYMHPENISRFEDLQMLFNIMKNHLFSYSDIPVMVYTCDNKGLSNYCKNPKKDYITNVQLSNTKFYERLIIADIAVNAYIYAPNYRRFLNNKILYYTILYVIKKILIRLGI